MNQKYDLTNQPDFAYGVNVRVDMPMHAGINQIMEGKIVGCGSKGVITIWLVEFPFSFPSYPYRVVGIPHTMIFKDVENYDPF